MEEKERYRYLRDSEAKLFANGILQIINEYDSDIERGDEDKLETLVSGQFENLKTVNEKFQVLEVIAFYLLRNTGNRTLRLSALVESAVYYVFAWYHEQFDNDTEIAVESYGQLIIDAYQQELDNYPERHSGDEEFLPTMIGFSKDGWLSAIDNLADQILWDRDFELEEKLTPPDPDFYRHLNIELNYFSPILDDNYGNVVSYSENSKKELFELCITTMNTHYMDDKPYTSRIKLYRCNNVETL